MTIEWSWLSFFAGVLAQAVLSLGFAWLVFSSSVNCLKPVRYFGCGGKERDCG